MTDSVLWLRVGDTSEYEQYGSDLSAVADVLLEAGIDPWMMAQVQHGFVAPGFHGANYVSLFWGDSDLQHQLDLSPIEFRDLRIHMTQTPYRSTKR